ncbi:MAG TPA: hypothetical protein VJR26_12200 [Candidatus Acidoferrales bacterium]|nr:hypothetical protein [Candidatus Acidoferrales bacterium]
MLWRKALTALSLLAVTATLLLAAPAAVWAQNGYLDDFIVRVKPDKVSQFEAIAKKIADANRHDGDRWLAMATAYGESNVYVFTSLRSTYADIDKGSDMFMGALGKSMGKMAAQKLLNDFNDCVISSRTQLRARRPDLSGKMPSDAQAMNDLVGKSRVLRVLAIRVRDGHEPEFEAMIKDINAHAASNPNTQPVFVSQAIEGGRGSVYYVTFFRTSMGGFDNNPDLKDFMGDEGMAKVEKTIAEVGAGSESTIYRFAPELSSPPDEITQASADFWRPKPIVASMPKPKMKAAGAPASSKDKAQH